MRPTTRRLDVFLLPRCAKFLSRRGHSPARLLTSRSLVSQAASVYEWDLPALYPHKYGYRDEAALHRYLVFLRFTRRTTDFSQALDRMAAAKHHTEPGKFAIRSAVVRRQRLNKPESSRRTPTRDCATRERKNTRNAENSFVQNVGESPIIPRGVLRAAEFRAFTLAAHKNRRLSASRRSLIIVADRYRVSTRRHPELPAEERTKVVNVGRGEEGARKQKKPCERARPSVEV